MTMPSPNATAPVHRAIAVLAPVLLGGVSPTLPVRLRLAAVVAVAFLVSLDSLRTERLTIPATILSALLVGGIVLGGAAIVGVNNAHAGLRAAILLVLWYGTRGVAGSIVGPLRRPGRSQLDDRVGLHWLPLRGLVAPSIYHPRRWQ